MARMLWWQVSDMLCNVSEDFAFFGWKGLFSITVRTQGLALCLVRTKAEQLKFTGLSFINSPFQGHCKESDLLCARHCSDHFHLLAL